MNIIPDANYHNTMVIKTAKNCSTKVELVFKSLNFGRLKPSFKSTKIRTN